MSLPKAFLIFTFFIASCHARPRPQPGEPFKFTEDKELFDEKMGRNSEGADKPTHGRSDNQDETSDEILGSRSKDASEEEPVVDLSQPDTEIYLYKCCGETKTWLFGNSSEKEDHSKSHVAMI